MSAIFGLAERALAAEEMVRLPICSSPSPSDTSRMVDEKKVMQRDRPLCPTAAPYRSKQERVLAADLTFGRAAG